MGIVQGPAAQSQITRQLCIVTDNVLWDLSSQVQFEINSLGCNSREGNVVWLDSCL
jgi:hypothetical protein